MFGLTGSFFLVEIVVGYVTNSMALVADSFHMLSDIAALIIAFISVKMAPKSWSKVSNKVPTYLSCGRYCRKRRG